MGSNPIARAKFRGRHFMYKLTRETLKIFWRHSKRYGWRVALLVAAVLVVTFFQTYIPLLYRDLIDFLSLGSRDNLAPAFSLVIFILMANIIRIVVWRAMNFVNNYFQARVMGDLMNTCYQHLQKHSFGFFTSNFVGSLVTKVKRYERAFEQIADQIILDLGRSLLDTGMILAVLLWQYRTFGLIMAGWCAFFVVFVYFFSRFKLPYDIQRAGADTRTTAQLADTITNNANIKLFANYDFEYKRFAKTIDEQFRLRKKSWDLGTIMDLTQSAFMIAIEFWVIYVAVRMWGQGTITVGDVTLLQVYLLRIFDKLWATGRNVRNIYEALADANEMTEILLLSYKVQDIPRAKQLTVRKGEIIFENVSFGYHDEGAILDDFSLKIQPGERVALIGPSGGGKSTIAKLLLRFYDIRSGKIFIDGQDISKVTQDSLREMIAFVPQDPILFHRSLMENIRYASPDAADEEVIRAAKLAHAHEFISSSLRGYDTLVGERGIKLSGGERQRVAIARAILKDAPILVLDEATSSLDSESEMYIQDALKKLMRGRTTIVIAHRLSTIMQMDRIVVIDEGKIIEEGKHEELLKVQKGIYQKLWEIQAGGFAMA